MCVSNVILILIDDNKKWFFFCFHWHLPRPLCDVLLNLLKIGSISIREATEPSRATWRVITCSTECSMPSTRIWMFIDATLTRGQRFSAKVLVAWNGRRSRKSMNPGLDFYINKSFHFRLFYCMKWDRIEMSEGYILLNTYNDNNQNTIWPQMKKKWVTYRSPFGLETGRWGCH